MKQDIWFIIVTYKLDAEALEKLQKNLEGKSVIIIDNSKKNFGFGGGANVGIQHVLEHGVDWVVMLNQDLQITKKFVYELEEAMSDCASGITGMFAGALDAKRWTTILPSARVDYISGSCIAIHRKVFEKIGFFYEPYFMYYEDADLCIRAKKAGFPLVHLTIPGISHTDATSLGRGSFLHQYYLARNHLLFVERNAPLGVKIHEILRLPKTIWEHINRKEWGALIGIRDYFLRRFGKYTPLW